MKKDDDDLPDSSMPKNSSEFTNWCTVENMLAVPIEYIFRDISLISTDTSVGWSPATPRSHTVPTHQLKTNDTTTHHRTKPLLSRVEAQLFLQVNTISYEIDSLTSSAVSALQQQVQYREFSSSLHRTDHPYLRPIVSLLHTCSETTPDETIQNVSSIMNDRIIPELQRLVRPLRQFSEQNWTLADTLDDGQPSVGGYHNILAHEKRKLSDLQEEVCQRIEGLLQSSVCGSLDTSDAILENVIELVSMKDYCEQLFEQQNDLPVIENSESKVDIVGNDDVNQSELSHRAGPTTENVDDEELDEAPDRSLTATPISSPEESPSMLEATTGTRAAILRNTSTTSSSPLLSFHTTTTTTHVARTSSSSTKDNPTTVQQSDTLLKDTTPVTNQNPQRQLEKSFSTPTTAEKMLEENEKENEPSQSSSQRSFTSLNSTQTRGKRQRLRQNPPETLPPPFTTAALLEVHSLDSEEYVITDDTNRKGDRIVQRSVVATGRSDNEEEDENDDRQTAEECFRTQNAAEVLSSLAATSVGASPSE